MTPERGLASVRCSPYAGRVCGPRSRAKEGWARRAATLAFRQCQGHFERHLKGSRTNLSCLRFSEAHLHDSFGQAPTPHGLRVSNAKGTSLSRAISLLLCLAFPVCSTPNPPRFHLAPVSDRELLVRRVERGLDEGAARIEQKGRLTWRGWTVMYQLKRVG